MLKQSYYFLLWTIQWVSSYDLGTQIFNNRLIIPKTSPQFWPDDTTVITTDYYRVKYLSKMNKCDYVSRDFVIQSIQDDYELNVRMLHCPSWPELGHPASIFDFIVDVHQRGNEYRNGPIVIVDKFV